MADNAGPNSSVSHFPNFDLLRLLLALEVMFGHVAIFVFHKADTPWYFNPVPAFVGISGFLVLGSLERSPSYMRFLWKRVCRVVPAFVVALILVALLLGRDRLLGSIETYLTVGLRPDPMGDAPLWSLSAEEILYGLMAVFFVLGAYRVKSPIWALFSLSFIGIPLLIQNQSPLAERIGWLAPAFLCGSLCYLYRDKLRRLPSWIWPAQIVLIAVFFPTSEIYPINLEVRYMAQFLATAAAFSVVGMGAWGPRIAPAKMPDLSYGVYVYHLPLLLWGAAHHWPWEVGALLTIGISAVSWLGMERHALKLKGWRSARSSGMSLVKDEGVAGALASNQDVSAAAKHPAEA